MDNKQEAVGGAGGPHAFSLPCLFPGDRGSLLGGREKRSPPTMTHHCVAGLVCLQPPPTPTHTHYTVRNTYTYIQTNAHIFIYTHTYTHTPTPIFHAPTRIHTLIHIHVILTHPQTPSDAHTSACYAHMRIHKKVKEVQYMK